MRKPMVMRALVYATAWLLASPSGHGFAAAPNALFTETVAPILRARCIRCHNSEKPRGNLDLSTRERMLKGGEHGAALVPGDAGKSLLVALISGPEPKMPKQGAHLTSEEIARVRYWIDQG